MSNAYRSAYRVVATAEVVTLAGTMYSSITAASGVSAFFDISISQSRSIIDQSRQHASSAVTIQFQFELHVTADTLKVIIIDQIQSSHQKQPHRDDRRDNTLDMAVVDSSMSQMLFRSDVSDLSTLVDPKLLHCSQIRK
jgi:hypothetical protein